jgi:SAM-dependent methyltransferase
MPSRGTGPERSLLPRAVKKVVAVEPSRVCLRIAEPRTAGSSVPVEHGGLTGEHLDLPSSEFDAVLSTWTMCTIPNLEAALAELRRVLKPGGTLHFVEHGHAPDDTVARWQVRLEPMNKRVAFGIDHLDNCYMRGPKPMSYFYEGRAVSRWGSVRDDANAATRCDSPPSLDTAAIARSGAILTTGCRCRN